VEGGPGWVGGWLARCGDCGGEGWEGRGRG